MKKFAVGFMVLTLLIGLLGANIGTASAKTSTVSASFSIASESKTLLAAKPAMTVFLYDEAGNLLSTKKNATSTFTLDVPGPTADVIKNYVVRVIADDGSVGVRYFSDHEAHAAAKASLAQEKSFPIVFSRSSDLTRTASVGLLSDGIIVKESTVSAGSAFTNVGELHACANMYASATLSSTSSVGIEGKRRVPGAPWDASLGYSYRRVNTSTYTSQYQTNSSDSTTEGGRYIQTEYSYKIEVWAQYDGNGDFVQRWEELSVDSLIGGIRLYGSKGGDCENYNNVSAGSFGSRELLQGKSESSREYNATHSLGISAKVLGADLNGQTAYTTGSKVNYYLWNINGSKANGPAYGMYAMYSRAGTAYSGTFPVMYWTHN